MIGFLPHNFSIDISERWGSTGLQPLSDAADPVLAGEIVLAVTEKRPLVHETHPFCGFSGHKPVPAETRGMKHHIWIRKGQA